MIETPWFKWFPAAWLSSETRLTMSVLERSVYRDLLDCCYERGSIPSDPVLLAKLADVTQDQFAEAWPKVSQKFIPCSDGRLSNSTVLQELAKRGGVSDVRANAGKAGGLKSGQTRRERSKQTPEAAPEASDEANPEAESNQTGSNCFEETKQTGSKPEANASFLLPETSKQIASLHAREEAEAEAYVDKNPPIIPPTPKPAASDPWSEPDLAEWYQGVFIGEFPENTWQVLARYVNSPDRLAKFKANTPLWMKTRKYLDGFGQNAVKFAMGGVWMNPPAPSLLAERGQSKPAGGGTIFDKIINERGVA